MPRHRSAGLLAIAVVGLAVTFAGCTDAGTATGGFPAPDTALAQVTCEEFDAAGGAPVERAVTVPVGEPFAVILCSNPSTGYSWAEPTWDGDAGIESTGRRADQPQDAPPGTAGRETFGFATTDSGTSTIDFAYAQPWEGGATGTWSVVVTVTVE